MQILPHENTKSDLSGLYLFHGKEPLPPSPRHQAIKGLIIIISLSTAAMIGAAIHILFFTTTNVNLSPVLTTFETGLKLPQIPIPEKPTNPYMLMQQWWSEKQPDIPKKRPSLPKQKQYRYNKTQEISNETSRLNQSQIP